MQYKEEDAGGLVPGKDDDAVVRKNSRKDVTLLDGLDYNYSLRAISSRLDLARSRADAQLNVPHRLNL